MRTWNIISKEIDKIDKQEFDLDEIINDFFVKI